MEEHPEHFGRYTIVKTLGSGAMGKVFLAEDPVLDRRVALKIISVDPNLETHNRQDFVSRFAAEAKASAKLDHPSIVQVYDAGEEQGQPWIAFQYVEGESLEDLIKTRGHLTVRRAVLFAIDIASALQQAHGWNIIHRDIKPANILIERSTGIAKIADFGIIQAPWAIPDREGESAGSPGYMSPEQIDGKDLDGRSDLFSLGVVVYNMITGKHPFIRNSILSTINATLSGEYTPIRELVPDIARPVEIAVRRCLFPDYRARISSAAELVALLQTAVPTNTTAQSAPGLSSIAPRVPQSRAIVTTVSSGTSFFRRMVILLAAAPLYVRARKNLDVMLVKLLGREELFAGENREGVAELIKSWSYPFKRLFRYLPLRSIKSKLTLLTRNQRITLCVAIVLTSLTPIVILAMKDNILNDNSYIEIQLIQECRSALERHDRESANRAVERMSLIDRKSPQTSILIGRVFVRNGNFSAADKAFKETVSYRGGKRTLKKELPVILDEMEGNLKRREITPEQIVLIVNTLKAGKNPVVHQWFAKGNDQLHRNAAKILRTAGVRNTR